MPLMSYRDSMSGHAVNAITVLGVLRSEVLKQTRLVAFAHAPNAFRLSALGDAFDPEAGGDFVVIHQMQDSARLKGLIVVSQLPPLLINGIVVLKVLLCLALVRDDLSRSV